MKVLIHYSEIGLKGKNRSFFENKLIDSIELALVRDNIPFSSLEKDNARLILELKEFDREKLVNTLTKVFGIKNFSFIEEAELELKKILKKAADMIYALKRKGVKEVSLQTTRSDKTFPLTSPELNKKIGELTHKVRIKINFKNTENVLYTEVTSRRVYFYAEKIDGLDGLPVGTSGKVLCLLSGGIDSPVAAYLMMKRGCKVDFLHFHALKENKAVLNTQIKSLINTVNVYQGSSKLFLVPYTAYSLEALGKVPESLDLVMFRNFILKFGQALAKRNGYKALVTGDSLGQVASQTLDNLSAAQIGINIPIFRPLISDDKEEIITLAKKINTFNDSIKPYKDCCSIISRKPSTNVKLEEMEKALTQIDMDKIIDQSLKQMEKSNLN